MTQKESRKFGRQFNAWSLYKYISGMNAVRLRKLLASLEGEDYPADPRHAYSQIRQVTMTGQLEIPHVDLDRDIGGYARIKQRLRAEILDVLTLKDRISEPDQIARLEDLIPKGMVFWGPPGTGKTLFAKALATAIGAAITVVSGPELKSKWVGESEENLRQIFHRARQSAPSIIVFDELDSFAAARGTYTGSGVEHSMVNQLLTEMDGFHREELVFVVGTTNFVEALDPALLRPGRFEFHLYIPYPESDDRREILRLYDAKMGLQMTPQALEYTVRRTADSVEGAAVGTRFSGDHLNALCRAIARIRLREELRVPTQPADVNRALSEWIERPRMTAAEERVVATHEAGHAVCALFCTHATPIERISIQGDAAGTLGFVRYQDPAHRYVVTRGQLLDDLCILMGGREAELSLLDDLSIGSSGDLQRATAIARAWSRSSAWVAPTSASAASTPRTARPAVMRTCRPHNWKRSIGESASSLEEGRPTGQPDPAQQRSLVETLRDLLLQNKVLDAGTLASVIAEHKNT